MTTYGEAARADIASDAAFAARLRAADEAGELTAHYDDPDGACKYGLWHEGPCPTPTDQH
jgi:hypothetical protein